MSTIKKLLALVLALTMVLSVSAFAGYTVAPYGDYASIDADAEEAVQLLYSLNIMKGDNLGNFNPEATITRAEVAKMIYVILNYGEDDLAKNYTGAKIFSDVAAGAWYEGYVNYCASTKLVQGRPDGTFGPNDPVTCAEAAKMLLTAIGYSAEARGYIGANWDKQVLADAAIIGLLEGYEYNTNTYAPRQWVAVMFMNALTGALTYDTIAPTTFNGLLTGVNAGNYDYVTMGWKYFELYDWSGIIVANEYADLYGSKPLSSDRTQIRYENDDEEFEYITFKNWSTDLTEIGEYARGWATGSKVLYVTDDGMNTEFSTGNATNLSTSSKFKSATGLKSGGEYFVNFDKDSFTSTGNGDWLRVVDNDDDGTADYVFKTTFTMATYTKIDSNDNLVLSNATAKDGYYEVAEDVAKDDVVIYTVIDGITYVELAPSFEGEAEKYTYKNDALTVDGETYEESDIAFDDKLEYYSEVELADKDIEYVYYQDFFGHIRLFGRDKADSGELVLLTDAYYETNRYGTVAAVDAYLDGEITDTDVRDSETYTDIEMFIDRRDTNSNDWLRLKAFKPDAEAKTHVARYSMNDEGVMSLYTAETWRYDTKGEKKDEKTGYIDLYNLQTVEADQTAYYGDYVKLNTVTGEKTVADDNVRVQANRDTVYYYVSYVGGKQVKAVTGYKNSYEINSNVTVRAMYAVATDVSEDSKEADYWVADVIVIETDIPVFNLLKDDIVLGYDIVNRAVSDYAYLDVIKADASLAGLNVISHNGDDFDEFDEKGTLNVLNFFYNTVDEEGDSYLSDLTDYADNDIYAGTVDRANVLYEYVVTTDGDDFTYTEDTVVYDIDDEGRYNSIDTVSAGLVTGKDYIFFAPKGEVVYAVLVNDNLTQDLYDAILLDTQDPSIAAAKRTLVNAYEALIDALAKADANWTKDSVAEAKDAIADAVADAELTVAELQAKADAVKAAVVDGAFVGYDFSDELWAAADKAYNDGIAGTSAAAAQKKVDEAAKAIDKTTINVTVGEDGLAAAIAAEIAVEGTTVEVDLPDYTLDGGAGQKTIEGVKVTYVVEAAEVEATATITVKATY